MIFGDKLDKLATKTVAVFGLGGVGSFAAEALVRAGVGRLMLVDNDTVAISNLNRQLIALHSTIGRKKTEVMRERALDINPNADIELYTFFYCEDTAELIDISRCDYIVDAIDTVYSKLLLIERAGAFGVPIISSMGTGNKLDPTRFEVSDIYKTTVCPLARAMRHELKKRGIERLKVVYSKEDPQKTLTPSDDSPRRSTPGSAPFVPPVAGMILAGEVIKELMDI